MIDLVTREIKAAEDAGKSWILQGFPRTKVQAMALQKMGIIPDKFILLNVSPAASIAKIKTNLLQINQPLYGPDLEDVAAKCLQEYELNIKRVQSVYSQFIFEHNAVDKA